jgi:hypothetical protein
VSKKVLVLVLALDSEPWRTIEEQGQKVTWASADAKVPVYWLHGQTGGLIRVWTRLVGRLLQLFGAVEALKQFRVWVAAMAAQRPVLQSDSRIVTGVPETYIMTNAKTVAGFRHILASHEFDYVLRTNSSTYVNLSMLSDYVQNLPSTNFYGGTLWTSGAVNYATGTSMLLSRDLVERVVDDPKWDFDLVDDLAVGMAMSRAGVPLNAFPRIDVCTSEDLVSLSIETLRSSFIVRCKGLDDREHDVIAMRRVHALYQAAGLS